MQLQTEDQKNHMALTFDLQTMKEVTAEVLSVRPVAECVTLIASHNASLTILPNRSGRESRKISHHALRLRWKT